MSDDRENFNPDTSDDVVFNTKKTNELRINENSQKTTEKNTSRPVHAANIKSPKKQDKNTPKLKNSAVSKKKLIVNITGITLSSIFIIAGIVLLVVFYMFTARINYFSIDNNMSENSFSNVSASESNTNEKSTDTYEGNLLNDRQILNILLIGADTRYNQDRGNSDTMILISVDTKHKKLKMLSFMRDTYVSIPGYGSTKLTHSFSYGGVELTVRTVQLNYGIQIDRYAIVDFNSFKGIIDKLGGLDIDLTQEEVDYIDWQTWKNHQADTRHELNASSYTYKPNSEGVEVANVHLNGRQALWHARNRGEDGICSGDDYVRTERQRSVITLMINNLKKSDFTTIMNVIYEIGPMVTTNLKASELTTLATNITKYLKYDIVSQSAPDLGMIGEDFTYEDYYPNGERLNVIDITDWDNFREKIADYVFGDTNRLKP